MLSPRTHDLNRYGPLPTGVVAIEPIALRSNIMPTVPVSQKSQLLLGCRSVTTTVSGPAATTDRTGAICALNGWVDSGAMTRSKLYTTSALVSGSPLLNVIP